MPRFLMTIKKYQHNIAERLNESPLPAVAEILLFEAGGLTREFQLTIRSMIPTIPAGINTIVVTPSLRKSGEDIPHQNGIVGSRTLSLKENWPEILECACGPQLQVVIPGNRIMIKDILKDDIQRCPPFSFPGKLLALMFKRFHYFNGALDKGLIIISGNKNPHHHELLESLVFELAHLNNLDPLFIDWIENANRFCGVSPVS